MKVLICAWLFLSCSVLFSHLSLICLGCCTARATMQDLTIVVVLFDESDGSVNVIRWAKNY